ncbi:MAG: alcohol dehydrogenase catalytic domain-containing protein [Hyphomicrobiales bacterium]|nr:alcohol dehydrogenase catalytic domain-containing protein [Hyphomicrobiales bacterium]
MRAIVIREPGPPEQSLLLETVPDPVPGPGQVVIRVEACGVCAHDVAKRSGILRRGIEMPLIPGHEVAGTIAGIGEDVRGYQIGQRVATTQRSHICLECRYCRAGREPLCDEAVFMGDRGLNGGYAEYVATDASTIAAIPDGVSFAQAAIAACAIGTVYHAAFPVGRIRPGETVLVTGASGGLGIHALQMGRLGGARVIAATSSPGAADMLRSQGADVVIATERGGDFSAAILAETSGAGADIVIDTVGTPVFNAVRKSLAKAGRWVMVGQVTGTFVQFNPAQLFLRDISMLSATSTTRSELQRCLSLIARDLIRPVVSDILPLEAACKAHALMEEGALAGRIVLAPHASGVAA